MAQAAQRTTMVESHRLRPMTGAVELAIADALEQAGSRPAQIAAGLTAALDRLNGAPAEPDAVERLACGAQDALLLRCAASLWPGPVWLQADCARCGSRYDLHLRLEDVPVTPPGPGFPTVTIETSLGPRSFDVPNGRHAEQVAALPAMDVASLRRRALAVLGIGAEAEADAARFSDADLARIDAALEAAAPEAADEISALCPNCGGPTTAAFDPLDWALPSAASLLREIHLLASAYHWSEREILDLPRFRRARYLALIEQADTRA